VAAISEQVGGYVALIDQYIATVDNINASISQIQANLDSQLGTLKTVIIIAMLWILIAQLAPLYLGWELVSGQRGNPSSAASTPSNQPVG